MNCNPFTFGHRYLIEESLKYIDHLFIFVVEEDKSIFPFKDRLLLVKKGVSDLNNKVTVLPSGKWMISLLTFPEYFSKDDLQEDIIDPSKDIVLFAKYICPILNITYRFVGEEPFDKVTKQYNDAMRKQLKEYNITFIEIPRKSILNGEIVSATKVRELIKNINNDENIEKLKKYVPKSTFVYLKNTFIKFNL